MGFSALKSSGWVLGVVCRVWFRRGSWGTQVLSCRRAPWASVPTGIGPCRCASVQSNVPAAEKELHSLHGGVDSSESWLWVLISVAFGGDLISHGEDSVVDPFLLMQMEGSGLASECTCSWEGAEAALASMNLWYMLQHANRF